MVWVRVGRVEGHLPKIREGAGRWGAGPHRQEKTPCQSVPCENHPHQQQLSP